VLFENLLQGVEFDPELHTQGDPATQVQGIVLLKSIECMRNPASVIGDGSLNWIEASEETELLPTFPACFWFQNASWLEVSQPPGTS
jgi:hypothetical protein